MQSRPILTETSPSPAVQPAASPPPLPRSKKKDRSARWVLAAIVLLLVGLGAGGYSFYRRQEAPISVQTEKVLRRNLTELVVATGKIQPVVLVKISPEVSGEIIELPVKEGQAVKKGDLILKIKPDFYIANRNSAQASHSSALAGKNLAKANLDKAEAEAKRAKELIEAKLISDSQFLDATTLFDVARAQFDTATHQAAMAKAALARADEELAKTTIYSPITGTISKLNSQTGERVVGTATMAGTDVMTIANLDDMEARVDIGEIDVVLIAPGQKARLEVDAFRDRKFSGTVTEIANTAKTTLPGQQQEATKFEVKIRINEKEIFRPGMSVTSEIETRYRTNVLTVPIQSVTTRAPKNSQIAPGKSPVDTNSLSPAELKKMGEAAKPIEVVFAANSPVAKMVKVTRGISDESYVEITDGLQEGQEVITGGYKAINRELEDGKKIKVSAPKPTVKTE